MKNKSFFFKIFLSFLTVIIFISVIFFAITSNYVKKQNLAFFNERLLENLNSAVDIITPLIDSKNNKIISETAKQFAKASQTRITIINNNGTVITDTETDSATMQNHLNRTEIKKAMAGEIFSDIRYSSTLNCPMLYRASPIFYDGQIKAILRISMPVSEINLFANSITKNLILIILVACIASLFLSYIFSKKISLKVKNITKAWDKISYGNFNVKIDTSENDELDSLAQSFNSTGEKIQNLFAKINEQKEQIEKIISSIDDIILLLNADGKIIIHNNAFEKHIRDINPDGRFYWEVFYDKEIEKSFNKIVKENIAISSIEVKEQNKYFLFNASKIIADETIVFTFHDITELKQTETVKKDFVANASHELKTPLTAIQGFVEIAQDETDLTEIKHYIDVIKSHSERLARIVYDLLSLSKLESSYSVDFEDVSLEYTVSNVLKMFKQKIDEKHLTINFKKDSSQKYIIKGNEFYLEQLIINLIENAIRYTEKGAITAELNTDNGHIILSVSDTGIGIPQEHLSRIFERFYVVDKARSRKSGGTGLGLSIVKYIVARHNATINVSSTVNKGTRFTIKF